MTSRADWRYTTGWPAVRSEVRSAARSTRTRSGNVVWFSRRSISVIFIPTELQVVEQKSPPNAEKARCSADTDRLLTMSDDGRTGVGQTDRQTEGQIDPYTWAGDMAKFEGAFLVTVLTTAGYYAPARRERGSKRCFCLSVCLSVRRVHSE